MRIIPTKTHGYLDYMVGLFLIAMPWLFGFADNGMETWIPVILGAGAIVYSLLTNYELGALNGISMKTHLTLDLMSGVLLAASPWIFGFADYVYGPHLIMGIMEVGVALLTKQRPLRGVEASRRHRTAH